MNSLMRLMGRKWARCRSQSVRFALTFKVYGCSTETEKIGQHELGRVCNKLAVRSVTRLSYCSVMSYCRDDNRPALCMLQYRTQFHQIA